MIFFFPYHNIGESDKIYEFMNLKSTFYFWLKISYRKGIVFLMFHLMFTNKLRDEGLFSTQYHLHESYGHQASER